MLEFVQSPKDVKSLKSEQLPELCQEIREVLMKTVSENGGHLASNLGVVELTVALHRCFNSPEDKIIFDVGHQCYTHKLLTGRYEGFSSLRKQGGLSGFTRPCESEHDPFVSGHSSTSVSAALGLSVAGQLKNEHYYTVAVLGDGALTGGMVYEALNNAGRVLGNRLIVILNDNKMSISQNVGAMARHLSDIRTRPGYFKVKTGFADFLRKIPLVGKRLYHWLFKLKTLVKNGMYNSTIFEDMGFTYIGPIDGHDLNKLENCMNMAKQTYRPALIHVCTCKGKGYTPAEQTPQDFHGVSSGMDLNTGECKPATSSFSHVFGETLCNLAREDSRICAITAAMCDGTGLSEFSKEFPSRFFDVGIAEEHAITFASGLAKGGMIPVVAIYSAFLQRGYDQLIHDVAAQGLKVILCVDRAGVVGEDGEMHHGIFDASYLRTVPGAKIYSPYNFTQLEYALQQAVKEEGSLIVIRYPRGSEHSALVSQPFTNGYSMVAQNDGDTAIVTFGRMAGICYDASGLLKEKGIQTDVIALQRIKPLPENLISCLKTYKNLYFIEENQEIGGVSQEILASLCNIGYNGKTTSIGIDDQFVPHGSLDWCLENLGMNAVEIAEKIEKDRMKNNG